MKLNHIILLIAYISFIDPIVQWENTSLTGMGSGVRIPLGSYLKLNLMQRVELFPFLSVKKIENASESPLQDARFPLRRAVSRLLTCLGLSRLADLSRSLASSVTIT